MLLRRSVQYFYRLTANKVWFKCPKRFGTGTGILLAAQPIVNKDTAAAKLQAPDPAKLSSKTLIRNASVLTIDSVTALLTQTTTTLLEVEEKYIDTVKTMLKLMELNIEVLGNQFREERAQDAILHFRQDLNTLKEQKQELEMILNCTEKVMTSAAEAAFLAGAEYAATAASERLASAKFQLELSRKKVQDIENTYHQMEAMSIKETTKHHKKEQEKMKKGESKESSDDNNIPNMKETQEADVDFKTLGIPKGGIPGEGNTGSDAELIITGTPSGGFPVGRESPAERGFPEDEEFLPDRGFPQEFPSDREQKSSESFTAEFNMESGPDIKIYGVPKGGLPGHHSNTTESEVIKDKAEEFKL